MKSLLVFVLIFYSSELFCQSLPQDTLMKAYLSQVKLSIDKQDYKSAGDFLKKAFALQRTLPDEAAYYNGVILYQQKKFAPAKSSFEKYLSLTEKSGLYYKEAMEYIRKTDQHICPQCGDSGFYETTDTCKTCQGKGKVGISCKTCKGKGKVLCKTCSGSGVIKYNSGFGGNFQNCASCSGKGYKTCQVCQGTNEQMIFCEHCSGKGSLKRRLPCDHKPSPSSELPKLK